jgi:ketosteroid isomerase-like protein
MSQESVEVVRQMNEGFLAFQNGDPSAMTTALAVLDPDIEWHGTVGGLDEGRVAHGYEELAQAFAENFEAWEQLILETERYIDAGDRVIVFWHESLAVDTASRRWRRPPLSSTRSAMARSWRHGDI